MGLADVKARALNVVRRGREVAWTPGYMRLGNLLYLGTWAFDGTPNRALLLSTEQDAVMTHLFPRWREMFAVRRKDVHFRDQRVMPWAADATSVRPPFYDYPHLREYVKDVLMPESPLAKTARPPLDAVVINVRRGDYYSNPIHRAEFGFNIESYVKVAVAEALEHGAIGSFLVVSDGVDWCESVLGGWLRELAPVNYGKPDLVSDLGTVMKAQRLIITNSTFSYWGGYMGDQVCPGRDVWAPWFYSRNQDGGAATQLLSQWHMVKEIPEGWGPV